MRQSVNVKNRKQSTHRNSFILNNLQIDSEDLQDLNEPDPVVSIPHKTTNYKNRHKMMFNKNLKKLIE